MLTIFTSSTQKTPWQHQADIKSTMKPMKPQSGTKTPVALPQAKHTRLSFAGYQICCQGHPLTSWMSIASWLYATTGGVCYFWQPKPYCAKGTAQNKQKTQSCRRMKQLAVYRRVPLVSGLTSSAHTLSQHEQIFSCCCSLVPHFARSHIPKVSSQTVHCRQEQKLGGRNGRSEVEGIPVLSDPP